MEKIEIKTTYLNKKGAEYFIEMGRYFGYPSCCIAFFVNEFPFAAYKTLDVHENKGFIPCPDCAKKIQEGKETLSSLIKNRKCVTPFPIDE